MSAELIRRAVRACTRHSDFKKAMDSVLHDEERPDTFAHMFVAFLECVIRELREQLGAAEAPPQNPEQQTIFLETTQRIAKFVSEMRGDGVLEPMVSRLESLLVELAELAKHAEARDVLEQLITSDGLLNNMFATEMFLPDVSQSDALGEARVEQDDVAIDRAPLRGAARSDMSLSRRPFGPRDDSPAGGRESLRGASRSDMMPAPDPSDARD